MSTKDKTRAKLMDSMRKTKESASAQSHQPTTASSAPKAQSKPAASTPAAKPAARKPASKAASSGYSRRGSDAYQSGGRIWPD
jgi:hypothetical protein